MITFTPKTGRLLALDGYVDMQAYALHPRMMDEAMDRGGRELLHRVISDLTTVKDVKRGSWTVKQFSIRALVLTEKEWREELEAAYLKGMHDASRFK